MHDQTARFCWPPRRSTPETNLHVRRVQYFDQPIGEFLLLGMEPIKTWNGEPVILTVANGGAGLILIGQDGSADAEIPVVSRFLFVRSKDAALAKATLGLEDAGALVHH
jgi:hypothetical protein